jgi:putative selenate reductase molybdopterin-binding subunit
VVTFWRQASCLLIAKRFLCLEATDSTLRCPFLAKGTGRPVRMVSDYIEEFLAGNPQHAVTVHLKTGVRRDDTLTAHQVHYLVNSGAYAAFKPVGVINGYNQAAGPYHVPHCRIESTFVYTNTIPCSFMRAPGEP